MAVKKEIIVTIDKEGNLSLEAVNKKGAECKDELGDVEKALGKAKERRWEKETTVKKNAAVKKIRTSSG